MILTDELYKKEELPKKFALLPTCRFVGQLVVAPNKCLRSLGLNPVEAYFFPDSFQVLKC